MKKLICLLVLVMVLVTSACAESKVIKVASSIDFPPYEYYDGDEIVGLDIDIIKAVAEKIGYELEIVDVQFDAIITAVVSGKYDMGVSGFTITEERKQSVDFSSTYTSVTQAVIVPEDSEITDVADLFDPEKEYIITVQQGTTSDLYITDDIANNNLKHTVDRYNRQPDALQAVISGKADCMIVDDQVAIAFVDANPGLKILPSAYADENYAFVFPKQSWLYEEFNAALDELIADGTVQAIVDKYIVK